jgi:hypothetical protein
MAKNTATNTRMTARDADELVGCWVNHKGAELRIEAVRRMGRAGWMMRLSNGALIRPSELC